MKNNFTQLSRKYHGALRKYLDGHSDLKPARAFGRKAVESGLKMLTLARIHEKSLSAETQSTGLEDGLSGRIKKASLFFAEVITPMERTHRVAREAAIHLSRLNQALKKRTAELAGSNRELKKQIRQRADMEKALRTSERHYSQLLEGSARLQEQLRYLSHQILSTQEEERKKISRELHDQIAATLTAISLELDGLKKEVADSNKNLKRRITGTQRLVKTSVEIIHRFARDLRPTTLDDLGLIPALHSLTRTLSKQTGIRVRLTVFAAVEEVDIAKRTVLYRVAQEALTNVVKHARASQVEVNIGKVRDMVSLSIKDDGKSFQVDPFFHGRKNKRLGLLGMRERVEMVGGNFNVESERGEGTSVNAIIPIHNSRGNGKVAARK